MTKEEKIICKEFLNDADKTHSCNEYKLLMALLEQKPKTDIRECKNCKYSKDGHMAGTEKCHECMWESKQEPKTGHWIKSDIGGAKVCSVCQAHMGLSNFKYCPNCGCRMNSEG